MATQSYFSKLWSSKRYICTHAEAGILSDRTSFKLYAAQNHLNYLKDIQHRHGHIMGKGRINAEMELDCYFAQIIGAKDSLLMRINEKVGLGINDKDVSLDEVYERLKVPREGRFG